MQVSSWIQAVRIPVTARRLQAFFAFLQVIATIVIGYYAFVQYKQQNALSYVERFYTGNSAEQQIKIAKAVQESNELLNEYYTGSISDHWARSIVIGREIENRMAAYFIFQLYEEIAKCYNSKLCDRDVIISFLARRMQNHHNILYPLGRHYGFNVGPLLDLLIHIKSCYNTDRKDHPDRKFLPIFRYHKVEMKKLKKELMHYQLDGAEINTIKKYNFKAENVEAVC